MGAASIALKALISSTRASIRFFCMKLWLHYTVEHTICENPFADMIPVGESTPRHLKKQDPHTLFPAGILHGRSPLITVVLETVGIFSLAFFGP
jgi:hypothetical protein